MARAAAFRVAIPSWGVGTGGTRFARFPGPGEPRTLLEKLDDCGVVQALVRVTPEHLAAHPVGQAGGRAAPATLPASARGCWSSGCRSTSMNSNTFQDQPGQPLSYKFGSLSHTDAAVRRQAIEHNLECLAIGRALGATSHTVWIGDGGNFPGQIHFRRAIDRYVESLRAIYAELPDGWRLFIEHKCYEPAFYSTVLERLGHQLPVRARRSAIAACRWSISATTRRTSTSSRSSPSSFDSAASAASISTTASSATTTSTPDRSSRSSCSSSSTSWSTPSSRASPGFAPAYMLDQSHNVTDPLESLMSSAMEVVRAYVQAHLVDRAALAEAQAGNDAMRSLQVLKQAFTTDVSPILAMARLRAGGAIDPITAYRLSFYREKVAAERPATAGSGSGIV